MSEVDRIRGIHHVTAMAGDPRRNVDFYTSVLGLRLVKRTVNFDDPGTWHLYYGDDTGHPGSIMTFFPWPGALPGRHGTGEVAVTRFAIPTGSLDDWEHRLKDAGITAMGRESHGAPAIRLADPDGLVIELVEQPSSGEFVPARSGHVDRGQAIRRFAGIQMHVSDLEPSARFLTDVMRFEEATSDENSVSFSTGDQSDVWSVEVAVPEKSGPGRMSAGVVHHVAWRVKDEDTQLIWRQRLKESGVPVTEVLDRQYFKSIYFREPGGILFEIATDPPGFTRDEDLSTLGQDLKLPPWLEPHRERIARALPALEPEVTA